MMKNFLLLTTALLSSLVNLSAQVPVVDSAQIASNKADARIDLMEQIVHEKNQREQIHHQVEQIRIFMDYLRRFGDPEVVARLGGLPRLLNVFAGKSKLKDAREIHSTGSREALGVLSKDGGGIFRAISHRMKLPDGQETPRDPNRYKPEAAVHQAIHHYYDVQTDVLKRREELRQALRETVHQVKAAKTASEVQKLSAVLAATGTELAAVDSELQLAADMALIQFIANENRARLESKATSENAETAEAAARKSYAEDFRLFTRPPRLKRNR